MKPEDVNMLEAFLAAQAAGLADLLRCLEDEQKALFQVDLDGLSAVLKRKEAISGGLLKDRQEMAGALRSHGQEAFELPDMIERAPASARSRLERLHLKLTGLEQEIALRRMENRSIINESIDFLDDLVGILTGKPSGRETYDRQCRIEKAGAALLLHREA